MKKLLLTAVSATALLTAGGAMAADERTQSQSDATHVTSEEMKQGWEDTKDAVSDAAHDAAQATKDAYSDLKNAMSDATSPNNVKVQNVTVNENAMASNMIGQPVMNSANERVGTLNDLIIDENGDVELAIIGDGDFFGTGKEVAIDYNLVAQNSANGTTVAPLTEEAINSAVEFSYIDTNAQNVKVLPMKALSVNNVLDGDIIAPNEEVLASIDDLIIQNGAVDHFVIGYNETLGMGGAQAALNYDQAEPAAKEGEVDFKLSANNAALFKSYAEKVSN